MLDTWPDQQNKPGITYMVNGVHGNTTGLGPRVALDSELMLGTRGLCMEVLAS